MSKKKKVLVIGGAGYIGSHMVRLLLQEKYIPVIFDNFRTGHRSLIPKGVDCVLGDLRVEKDINKAFARHSFDSVIHFAAASLVGESVYDPLKYYDNNVVAFVQLIKSMRKFDVSKIIFSSTAATFGEPKRIPIREDDFQLPTNPYGQSKLMMEKIVMDAARAYGNIEYIILRYFNVAGAWEDGTCGEIHDPETHIIPNILKSLLYPKKPLTVYGNDYPTRDGTCLRDYIHVVDLCEAHLLALSKLGSKFRNQVFNLGTRRGTTILELIAAVEKVTGKKVRYKMAARRPGDPARLVTSYQNAQNVLGWTPKRDLHDIIDSAWKWELKLKGQD